jgi:hypothetical protein
MNPWENDPIATADAPWETDPVADAPAPWENDPPEDPQELAKFHVSRRLEDAGRLAMEDVRALQPGLQLAQEPLPELNAPEIQVPPADLSAATAAREVELLVRAERNLQDAATAGAGSGVQQDTTGEQQVIANEVSRLRARGMTDEDIAKRREDLFALTPQRAARLSDGTVTVNPELVFQPEAWDAAAREVAKTPEEFAAAQKARIALREDLAPELDAIASKSDAYMDFLRSKARAAGFGEDVAKLYDVATEGDLIEQFYRETGTGFGNLGSLVSQSMKGALASTGQGIYGALDMATPDFITGKLPQELAAQARATGNEYGRIAEAIGGGWWAKRAANVAGGLVSTLPAIAAAPLGFNAMAMAGGALQAGQTQSDALAAGYSPIQAQAMGLGSGALEAGITKAFGQTGVEALTRGPGAASLGRRILQGSAEVPEELLQQVAQIPFNAANNPGYRPTAAEFGDTALTAFVAGAGMNALNRPQASPQAKAADATATTTAPAADLDFTELDAELDAIAESKGSPTPPPAPSAARLPEADIAAAAGFDSALMPFLTSEETGVLMGASREQLPQIVEQLGAAARARKATSERATMQAETPTVAAPPAPVAPDEDFARRYSFPRGLLPFVSPEEAGAVAAAKEGSIQLTALQGLMRRASERMAQANASATSTPQPKTTADAGAGQSAPASPQSGSGSDTGDVGKSDMATGSASTETLSEEDTVRKQWREQQEYLRDVELRDRLNSKNKDTRHNAEVQLMARAGLPWTNKPEQAALTKQERAKIEARIAAREAAWNAELEAQGVTISAEPMEADENVPFSQEKRAERHDAVTKAVTLALDELGVGSDVVQPVVIRSVDEIADPTLRAAATASMAAGNQVNAFYTPGKNGAPSTATFISGSVKPERARELVMHEVAGHHGLRVLFQKRAKDWRQIVERLWERLSKVKQFPADLVKRTGYNSLAELSELYHRPDEGQNYDPATFEGRSNLIEEHLAHLAAHATKPSWWQAVVSQIRDLVRKISGGRAFKTFSDADVNVLLSKARKASRKPGRSAAGTRFIPQEGAMSQERTEAFKVAQTSVAETVNGIRRITPPDFSFGREIGGGERIGTGWNNSEGMSNAAVAALRDGKIREDDLREWIATELDIPVKDVTRSVINGGITNAQLIYPEYHHVSKGGKVVRENFYASEELDSPKFWQGVRSRLRLAKHKEIAKERALQSMQKIRENLIVSGSLGTWSSKSDADANRSKILKLDSKFQSLVKAGEMSFSEAVSADYAAREPYWLSKIELHTKHINGPKGATHREMLAKVMAEMQSHPGFNRNATGATEAAPALDSRQNLEGKPAAPTRAGDVRLANRATEATSEQVQSQSGAGPQEVNIRFSQEKAERDARAVERALSAKAEDLEQYQTQRKIKESDTEPDAVKQAMNGLYAIYSDKQAQADAKAWIEKDGPEAVERTLLTRTGLDKRDVAAVAELRERFNAMGQYARTAELLNKVLAVTNTQAQAIQAMHLLMDRTTPEGAEAWARKQIERAGASDPEVARLQAMISELEKKLQKLRMDAATGLIVRAERTIRDAADLTAERKVELNHKLNTALIGDDGTDATKLRVKGLLVAAGMKDKDAAALAGQLVERFRQKLKTARKAVLKAILKVPDATKRIPKGDFAKWEKLNDEGVLSDAKLFGDIATRFKFPVFTAADAEKIRGFLKEYNAATDAEMKMVAGARMLEYVEGRTNPATLGDKISTLFKLTKLMSFKTIERNIIGNAAAAVGRSIGVDVPMWIIRSGVSLATGRKVAPLQTAIGNMVRGQGEVNRLYRMGRDYAVANGASQIQGIVRGLDTLMTAARYHLVGVREAAGIKSPHRSVFTSKAGQMFEKLMSAALTLPDLNRFYGEVRAELAEQMRAAGPGVVVPTAEMYEAAYLKAQQEIYQGKNQVTEALNMLVEGANRLTGSKKFGLGTVLMTFVKVPANMLLEGATWSPLGFVRALYQGVRAGKGLETKERAWTTLMKATAGTAGVMPLGYWLAALGVLTAAYDEDKDIAALQRASGWQAYSLNLSMLKRRLVSGNWHTREDVQDGDQLISYQWAQPMAFALAAGAERWRRDHATGDQPQPWWERHFIKPAASGFDAFLDSPMVTGISQFVRDLNFAKQTGDWSYVARTPIRALDFVPAIVRDVRYIGNNTLPETRSASVLESELSRILGAFPMVDLPTRYNTLGEAEERYQAASNSWRNVLFNPASTTYIRSNPVAAEALRLYALTGDNKVAPNAVNKSITLNTSGIAGQSQKLELTSADISKLSKLQGQLGTELMRAYIATPQWAATNDFGRAKIMATAFAASQNAAKAVLFGHKLQTIGPSGRTQDIEAFRAIMFGKAAGLIP